VGPIETFTAMTEANVDTVVALLEILAVHFVLPAIIALVVSEGMRKLRLIKNGDMKL